MNEKGQVNVRHDWPAWILILLMLGIGLALWPSSPEKLPVHWNWQGQPDRMGGKFEGLMVPPLLTAAIYLLLIFLPRIDPGRANYKLFRSSYTVVRVGIVGLMAGIYFVSLAAQRNPDMNLIGLVPFIIGVMFVVFGNLLGKIRPNWFVGIKTPWTLMSKRSWTSTHRAGGIGMVILGIVLMPLGYLKTKASLWILLVGVIGWTVFLMVYSYFAWKNDPDRITPAGSGPGEEEQ